MGGFGFQRQRHTSCQSTPATADQHISRENPRLDRLFSNFQPHAGLARNHQRLVIGPDQRQPALLRQIGPKRIAVLGGAVIKDHLGPIGTGVGDLHGGGVLWHHDHSRGPK